MQRYLLLFIFLCVPLICAADNQTPTVSPVQSSTNLPFNVSIDLLNLQLPNGWHSGAVASWKGKCLLVAGRTNGLHGFSNAPPVNNFPPSAQNEELYVIDLNQGKVWHRALSDPASNLTNAQIDTLSVTSPQFYQNGRILYIAGGYGIDSATGEMTTKSTLNALDVPKLIKWVTEPEKNRSASASIRQTSHPLLQVTGGYMNQVAPHLPTLLIFGQNFNGLYRPGSNGAYTEQVRSFYILDNGKQLQIVPSHQQPFQTAAYRRRDLNVVPIMQPGKNHPTEAYVAFSGVFTESGGVWTVPVTISSKGESSMSNPSAPATFKQAMNNYACPTVGLFSAKNEEMYVIFFGGMTFGYFENGIFETDSEIPFTNQVTTIKIDSSNCFSQYLMSNQYPTLLSTFSNPGNTLLFGSSAQFVQASNLPCYRNDVLAFDRLKKPVLLGYIIGGIQSTLPNTNSNSDSAASPYIFQVMLQPNATYTPDCVP